MISRYLYSHTLPPVTKSEHYLAASPLTYTHTRTLRPFPLSYAGDPVQTSGTAEIPARPEVLLYDIQINILMALFISNYMHKGQISYH